MIRELWAQDCVPSKLTGLFWSALFSIINQYSAGWSCLLSDCEFMSYLASSWGKIKLQFVLWEDAICAVFRWLYTCMCVCVCSFMYTWSSWLYKMRYFCHLHGNSLLLLLYVYLWSCTSHPFQHTHTHTLQARASLQFFLRISGCSFFLLPLWSLSRSLTKSDLPGPLWPPPPSNPSLLHLHPGSHQVIYNGCSSFVSHGSRTRDTRCPWL